LVACQCTTRVNAAVFVAVQNRASDRVVIDDRKSKSFEEREEQYVEARNRIFQQHSVSHKSVYVCKSHLMFFCFERPKCCGLSDSIQPGKHFSSAIPKCFALKDLSRDVACYVAIYAKKTLNPVVGRWLLTTSFFYSYACEIVW